MGAGKSSVRRTFNTDSHRGHSIACGRSSVRIARGVLGCDRYSVCYAINDLRNCIDFDCRYGAGGYGRRRALVASYFPGNLLVFAAAVFVLGLLCAAFRMERSAYRNAGVTFAIIVLIPRSHAAWIIALHRFFEVSVGILVALAVVAVWPEPPPGSAKQNAQ
jgi:fusaric acid resistance family protein